MHRNLTITLWIIACALAVLLLASCGDSESTTTVTNTTTVTGDSGTDSSEGSEGQEAGGNNGDQGGNTHTDPDDRKPGRDHTEGGVNDIPGHCDEPEFENAPECGGGEGEATEVEGEGNNGDDERHGNGNG